MTEHPSDDDITARLRAALDELTATTGPSSDHVTRSAPQRRTTLVVVSAALLVALVAAVAFAWGQRDTKHSISSPPASAAPEVDVSSTTAAATIVASTVPVPGAGTGSTTTVPVVSAAQRYEALTTVLQNADHGPELCLSGVLDSLPPICGDVPVTNWDWAAVPEAQTIGEVTWVDSVVVSGTYDGSRFTLTASPHQPSAEDMARFTMPAPSFAAPCRAPADGWAAEAAKFPNGSNIVDAMTAVTAYVNSQSDYSGGWVDQSINHTTDPEKMNDPQKLILVEQFTGDLAKHEAALREIWPGALCVALGKYTSGEVQDIQDRISELLSSPELPPHSFFGGSVNIDGTITATVVVATPQLQQVFDATFGAGVVTQKPVLRAVDSSTARQSSIVLAIGDNVMLGAEPQLTAAGITVDAQTDRTARDILGVIDTYRSTHVLQRGVVIQIGTNSALTADQFDAILAPLSDLDRVIVLTVHVPRQWQDPNNAIIRALPQRHPNVSVVDWDVAVGEHPEWLNALDGTHLSDDRQGAAAYTKLITEALSAS